MANQVENKLNVDGTATTAIPPGASIACIFFTTLVGLPKCSNTSPP